LQRQSPEGVRAQLVLIDASLADRPLAQVLRLVGYNSVAVSEQFPPDAPDPQLILWLGLQRGVWVTADERARRTHSQVIRSSEVSIVWVRRDRRQGMSTKDQILLILWVIDEVVEGITRSRSPVQFIASYNGKRPKLERLS
jgi:hypothetical protein